ncbi:reverse transcriptase domain-containing protein [Tanacetum coccineum]
MNVYKITLQQFQVNTKFLNSLPSEWSKFVTDVKLVRDLHTTNFDQLHAYLEQHELHANEVRRNSSDATGIGTCAYASGSKGNSSRQPKIVKCYNCQGMGHMARQCTQPKRKRDALWFRDKVLLVEAQGKGQVLDEEKLAFLADPGVVEGPVMQQVITHNAAYQANDLDAYDSDCDDISTAKAIFMANLSNYGSDVLFEEYPDDELTSDSNIISYSQYLRETQQAAVQNISLSAQNDDDILSVIEQLSVQMINHVDNWTKANKESPSESLATELERYKERVQTFEPRLNIDLSIREKFIES